MNGITVSSLIECAFIEAINTEIFIADMVKSEYSRVVDGYLRTTEIGIVALRLRIRSDGVRGRDGLTKTRYHRPGD